MTFLESTSSQAIAGVVVAGVAIAIGYLVSRRTAMRITEPLEKARGRREREEAATEEFYRAYGSFFAAWKTWAAFKPDSADATRTPSPEEKLSILMRVADAEGSLESFLVRLTLEQPLSKEDLLRLWCFRRGYRQLRYAVKEGNPLGWRRSTGPDAARQAGYRSYLAFKALAGNVAAILLRADERRGRPVADEGQRNLEIVTGSDPPLYPELELQRHAEASWPSAGPDFDPRSWRWVLLSERLNRAAASPSKGGPEVSSRPRAVSSDQETLVELNRAVADLEQRRDADAIGRLDSFISPDLIFRRATGQVVGKSEFMHGLEGQSPFVKSSVPRHPC